MEDPLYAVIGLAILVGMGVAVWSLSPKLLLGYIAFLVILAVVPASFGVPVLSGALMAVMLVILALCAYWIIKDIIERR